MTLNTLLDLAIMIFADIICRFILFYFTVKNLSGQ